MWSIKARDNILREGEGCTKWDPRAEVYRAERKKGQEEKAERRVCLHCHF